MKVLVYGSGGREHALTWKLAQSSVIDDIFIWPPSPVMGRFAKQLDLHSEASHKEVLEAAVRQRVDFVVVGPEGPLASGFADVAKEVGLPCFGPVMAAAKLESSKAFAKAVMKEAGIPTAAYTTVSSREECLQVAQSMLSQSGGVVLKASGLAGGKGVFVCTSEADLLAGVERLYDSNMRVAAEEVVLEEVLVGRECSFFTFVGQGDPAAVGFAVDFKRLSDGDKGPNTGGMGCYTPVPWLPKNAADLVMSRIVEPLLSVLKSRGVHYSGCLYVGLMWDSEGPKVVEFNVRLGDPEAQVLAVQDDRDWGALISGSLGLVDSNDNSPLTTSKSSVCVVMASKGYPYSSMQDVKPTFSESLFVPGSDSCATFAAAVGEENGQLFAGSGRVLTVAANGGDFAEARRKVYTQVAELAELWPGVQYRRDIAKKVTDEG